MESIDRKILVMGTLVILCGILIGIIPLILTEDPNLHSIGFQFAGIVIGAGIVELLIQFVAVKRLIDDASNELSKKIKLPIEEFYENRDELPSFKDELKEAKEIWFAWHTGSVQAVAGLEKITSAKKVRLIVMHPKSSSLDEIQETGTRPKNLLQEDIELITRRAKEIGIKVRWFKGPIFNSVIICNPNARSKKAWARIEFVIPFGLVKDRFSIRVSKYKGSTMFNKLLESYKTLWSNSIDPPDN